jgi:hypothetical protein
MIVAAALSGSPALLTLVVGHLDTSGNQRWRLRSCRDSLSS